MKKNTLFFNILALLSVVTGCKTIVNVSVDPVRQWEGHYMSVEDFKTATENISLQEGESIWVLSNKTLYRTLTNLKK